MRPQFAAIAGAIAFPFNLPPILGLGNTGGFQYVLEALQGQPPTEMRRPCAGCWWLPTQQPELAGVFSTYAADTPQIYLDIDRDKAQVLGVKISDIFNALQSTLGSYYVNDFNVFRPHLAGQCAGRHGRSATASTTSTIYVRNAAGDDGAAPGDGRGQARAGSADGGALQRLSRRGRQRRPEAGLQFRPGARGDGAISAATLPPGYGFEWTGTAFQEKAASGEHGLVLGLAFCSLICSWLRFTRAGTSRFRRLLSVSVGILGALGRVVAGLSFDVYAQIGLGRADRACRQERHSDRRLCGGATRLGKDISRRRH